MEEKDPTKSQAIWCSDKVKDQAIRLAGARQSSTGQLTSLGDIIELALTKYEAKHARA